MPSRTLRTILAGLLLQAWLGGALAGDRADFLAAENALGSGDSKTYQRLKDRLRDYPLFQYLEYDEIRPRLGSASSATVTRFLESYPDTPLADRLRKAWLERLATEKRWTEYARFYDPADDDITRRCRYLNALILTGRKQEAFAETPPVWRYGHSRPDACNPVFAAWRAAGGLSADLVWERVALAMDEGSTRLAGYLERYLPATDKPWLDRWLKVQEDPARRLSDGTLKGDHAMKKAIVAYGIKRLARSDQNLAVSLWKRYRTELGFSEAEACPVDERLAIILEDEPDALAYRFFQELEPCRNADRLQEARIRAALMRQDWPAVARWIDALPEEHRNDERWRYWKGRALAAQGDSAGAEAQFRAAAAERTYYGFLAADRIGAPYRYDDIPISVPDDVLQRVLKLPAMQRTGELYALGRIVEARREWYHLVQRMDNAALRAAASVFDDWGWIDRAIFTAARADYWDDLNLRFPVRHADLVARHAGRRDLDPSWVFGVIRQESAFMEDARSHAGAIGLMQLMPNTAKLVARKLAMPRSSGADLIDPDTNIALGTGYLRMMLDDLADQPVLATAAYNAGPHRVKRWLPPRTLDADIWVELIPFRETRLYVQRVMAYAAIYDQRLGGKPVRLSKRMGRISAAG